MPGERAPPKPCKEHFDTIDNIRHPVRAYFECTACQKRFSVQHATAMRVPVWNIADFEARKKLHVLIPVNRFKCSRCN